jgi:hypothetical protein
MNVTVYDDEKKPAAKEPCLSVGSVADYHPIERQLN